MQEGKSRNLRKCRVLRGFLNFDTYTKVHINRQKRSLAGVMTPGHSRQIPVARASTWPCTQPGRPFALPKVAYVWLFFPKYQSSIRIGTETGKVRAMPITHAMPRIAMRSRSSHG